jgi:hypothetical protein
MVAQHTATRPVVEASPRPAANRDPGPLAAAECPRAQPAVAARVRDVTATEHRLADKAVDCGSRAGAGKSLGVASHANAKAARTRAMVHPVDRSLRPARGARRCRRPRRRQANRSGCLAGDARLAGGCSGQRYGGVVAGDDEAAFDEEVAELLDGQTAGGPVPVPDAVV